MSVNLCDTTVILQGLRPAQQPVSLPTGCLQMRAVPTAPWPGIGANSETLITDANLQETDFVAWTERQARLRTAATERCPLGCDWESLAKEIESIGQSYRRALANHARKVIECLLKLQHAPANESHAAWIAAIDRERSEIQAYLEDEPGLRPRLPEIIGT